MYEPKVSVITPVYGVEPYIGKYLDSIMNQTYKNLEIICVDDKSPDNCPAILDAAVKQDPRIKVIHREKNGGIGAAVNTGLDAVTGAYVGFADPDDWLEPDFFEKAVGVAESTGAGIVITNFFREYDGRSEKMENAKTIPDIFKNKNDAFVYGFEADVYRGFKMYLWNKLFRVGFFTEYKLRMAPDLRTGADSLLSSRCFLRCNLFAYTPEPLYHYRIRENSIMRSADFPKRLGFEKALESIADMLEGNCFEERTVSLIKRFHTYYASQLAEFAYSAGDKNNLEFSLGLVRKYLDTYIRANSERPDRAERIKHILELKL